MREYNYVNDIGHLKKIVIDNKKNKNGKYNFSLWSLQTGDFCGNGEKTKEDIDDFLKHYKIEDTFEAE